MLRAEDAKAAGKVAAAIARAGEVRASPQGADFPHRAGGSAAWPSAAAVAPIPRRFSCTNTPMAIRHSFRNRPLRRRAGRLVSATLLAACTVLASCGKSTASKEAATQVAVKVNGDEISVHQVNQALSHVGALSPEQASAAGKKVLEQLIDQQLLIQKSIEKKLDRDPDVLNAIEASRRQILSQAYLEKSVAASVAKPSADDVRKFYAAHPELFSQRRVYRFQELTVSATPAQVASLREQAGKTKNMNEIVDWLKGQQLHYNAGTSVRAAEQLPQELLPRIAQMKDGDIGFTDSASGVMVVQLAGSQTVPIAEPDATPYIERYLVNQKRTELASNELKQLRDSAKLEYMGDFVKTAGKAGDAKAAAARPANTPKAAVAADPAPAAQPVADQGGQKPAASAEIDKGVSGLQ
jgi:EpsD family peptidyl-prolyl cis-trans isomerase